MAAGLASTVERHGPWTTNITLAPGLRTRSDAPDENDRKRIRRLVQIVSDVAGRPVADLRILDLACLEGQVAIEFAMLGARVVGIEGRESNIAKARFAAEALGLANLELHQDDVRNLSRESYGRFDVVLCLGILYHLDDEDMFGFMEQIAEVCDGVALIDTHVGHSAERTYLRNGKAYAGTSYVEHEPDTADEDKIANPWASLDNVTSLWLTRPSLYNLLSASGFTSVWECQQPRWVGSWVGMVDDRVTLLAVKGEHLSSLPSDPHTAVSEDDWPELEATVEGAAAASDEQLQAARRRVRRLRGRVRSLEREIQHIHNSRTWRLSREVRRMRVRLSRKDAQDAG